jgi:hypothetical protein
LVATLEQVFREEWGRVLATLIGFLGDFDLAEEAALPLSRLVLRPSMVTLAANESRHLPRRPLHPALR